MRPWGCMDKVTTGRIEFSYMTAMHIYYDNKTTISIAHNLVFHDRTKHIKIAKHFIKEKIDARAIWIPYLLTIEQIAYVLTKRLPKLQFDKLIDKLAMGDIFKPFWEGVSIILFPFFLIK